jgi:hypothetical protein
VGSCGRRQHTNHYASWHQWMLSDTLDAGASAWWEIVECLEAREGGYWVAVKGLAEGYFLIGATNLDAEGGVADAGAGGEIAADSIRYYYISYSSAPGAPTVTEVPSSGIATDSERAVRGEALAVWPSPSGGCVRLRTHVQGSRPPSVTISDVTGRRICVLDAVDLGSGEGMISWNGRDQHGRVVPAGTYFATIRAGGAQVSKRIILIR